LVDQARNLESSTYPVPSTADQGIDIACVCSNSLGGKLFTTNVEELVAASAYLPLLGRDSSVRGDGIVPLDLSPLWKVSGRRVILDSQLLDNE
jgi:hypothetical protein